MKTEDVIIWIDLVHAKLFYPQGSQAQNREFRASYVDHHTHRLENDERDCPSMYDRVADALKTSSRVLIVGPGVAKYHLLSRLRENFPLVAKKVVACESLDHISDGEVMAYARDYWSAKPGGSTG